MSVGKAEGLVLGLNVRDGDMHEEYHWPCGCAFHSSSHVDPAKSAHVHSCAEHAGQRHV